MTDSEDTQFHIVEQEEWREIPGFEGFYSASSLGRIRRDAGGAGACKGRIFNPPIHHTGYKIVILMRDGIRKTIYVHRAVASAFLGKHPSSMCVNHKDSNKLNNSISNLEFCTFARNSRHCAEKGRSTKGERNSHSKLTREVVIKIRRELQNGATPAALAAQYGVHKSTICSIQTGKTWKHVSCEPKSEHS